MSMSDRRRKRSWLRLIGAVEDNAPSGSSEKQLTPSLIDSTLGLIQEDDVWVALACLDAIENKAEVGSNAVLLKHLLSLGLESSDVGEELDLSSKGVIHKLAIRKLLLRYKRKVDVWEQVYYTNKAAAQESDTSVEDKQEEYDAWDEGVETKSCPVSVPLAGISLVDFIRQSPLTHAIQLASSCQASRLSRFVKALPSSLFYEIYLHRLPIANQLLLSAPATNTDLTQLLDLRFLPDILNGIESDIWTDSKARLQDTADLTDKEQVTSALTLHGMLQSSEVQDSTSQDHRAVDEDLTESSILAFYENCINSLEKQSSSLSAAIQLAGIVLSDNLKLPANESIARLAEDLRLLQPLVQGASSSSACSSWTLKRFRDELIARPVLSERQAMATLYLQEARSKSDAIEAARNGALPFLRMVAQRYTYGSIPIDGATMTGFFHTILALGDKGEIGIVRFLLEGSTSCGAELNTTEQGRITLACLLGTSKLDSLTRKDLDELAVSTIEALKGIDLVQKEQPLREYIGSALHQGANRPLPPSQVYRFFDSLQSSTLRYHIERCRLYLQSCQILAVWNKDLTVSWLANAQGQREIQLGCLTRIVRYFARDHKPHNQWTSLVHELMEAVGTKGPFDALQEKDVAHLVVEGALRTGDMRTFSYVMREHCGSHLSNQELADTVLQASREFYDNATSANVHEGNMKIAHEILTQFGPPTTPRIEQEKAFIEATSRLCSFRIQSMLRPGVLLAPIEIRLSSDRMNFIKRLLEWKEDAYKTPDLVLDLAVKLCAVPSGADGKDTVQVPNRTLIESRTLLLLTEAALGQADYSYAQMSCERLVINVAALGKRVDQSAANQGPQFEQLQELLRQTQDCAHRSCFLLCSQEEWKDHASRLRWCSYVLAYCPDDQVEKYLKTWRRLEQDYQEFLLANPPKDWDQIAIQLKSGPGGLASSFASIGNLGSLESLSPFSTLFASTRNSRGTSQDDYNKSMQNNEDNLPARVGNPSSRAAKLFDSLGGSGSNVAGEHATYLDPAERAARAARRFFGGFGS